MLGEIAHGRPGHKVPVRVYRRTRSAGVRKKAAPQTRARQYRRLYAVATYDRARLAARAESASAAKENRMAAAQRFFITIGDLSQARGEHAQLSFDGISPDSFASTLQSALREPSLWQRWKALQPDPDAVDPTLGASDPVASVTAKQSNLHTDIEVVTNLPHAIVKHRLNLLAGRVWKLHDVKPA